MADAPLYILFAGVNGAGKSTLYRSGLWGHRHGARQNMLRVNPDEILAEAGERWDDEAAQARAGVAAAQAIRKCLARGASLNHETTLAGRTALAHAAKAKELGYTVVVNYVGVEDPEVANMRIAHRTDLGGHGIDPALVERRWEASRANLPKAIGLCDEVYLYDNTHQLKLIARFEHGDLTFYDNDAMGITWHEAVVRDLLEHV